MKYSRILIAIGTIVLILIMIGRCHNGDDTGNDNGGSNGGDPVIIDSGGPVGGPIDSDPVGGPKNEVDDLLEEKIRLINRATDILYNECTPEGIEELKRIQLAETELKKKIDTLSDAEREEFYNNPELKEAINRLERAKEYRESGL